MYNQNQEEELKRKVKEILGKPGETRKDVVHLLQQLQTEYNLDLPEATKQHYGISENDNLKNKRWYRLLNVLTRGVATLIAVLTTLAVIITKEYEAFEWVIISFIALELVRHAVIYIVAGRK